MGEADATRQEGSVQNKNQISLKKSILLFIKTGRIYCHILCREETRTARFVLDPHTGRIVYEGEREIMIDNENENNETNNNMVIFESCIKINVYICTFVLSFNFQLC